MKSKPVIASVVAVCLVALAISFTTPALSPAQGWFGKQTLVVFSADGNWCLACKEFESGYDSNAGMLQFFLANVFAKQPSGKHYIKVGYNTDTKRWSHPALVVECKRDTGQDIRSVPAFWVRGQKTVTFGYQK